MAYLCGIQEVLLVDDLKTIEKIQKLDNLLEMYWENEIME